MIYLPTFIILVLIIFNIFSLKNPFVGFFLLVSYLILNLKLYKHIFSVFDEFRQYLFTGFFVIALLTLLGTAVVDFYRLSDYASIFIYALPLLFGIYLQKKKGKDKKEVYVLKPRPLLDIRLPKVTFLVYFVILSLFIISFLNYRRISLDDWVVFFGSVPLHLILLTGLLIGFSYLIIITSRNFKLSFLISSILFGIIFFSRAIYFGLDQIQFGDIGRTIANAKIILTTGFLEPGFGLCNWIPFGKISLPGLFLSSKFFHGGIYGIVTTLEKLLNFNINYFHILLIPTLFVIFLPIFYITIIQLIDNNSTSSLTPLFSVLMSFTLIYAAMFSTAGSLGVLFFFFLIIMLLMYLKRRISLLMLSIVSLTNLLVYPTSGIVGIIMYFFVIFLRKRNLYVLAALIPFLLVPTYLYLSFKQTHFDLNLPYNLIFYIVEKLENWRYALPNLLLAIASIVYIFSKLKHGNKEVHLLIFTMLILFINDFIILGFVENARWIGYRLDLVMHILYVIFFGMLISKIYQRNKNNKKMLLLFSSIIIFFTTFVYIGTKYNYRYPLTAIAALDYVARQKNSNEEIYLDADLASYLSANGILDLDNDTIREGIINMISASQFIYYRKDIIYQSEIKGLSSFWFITSPWQMSKEDIDWWRSKAYFRKDIDQFSVLHIKVDSIFL